MTTFVTALLFLIGLLAYIALMAYALREGWNWTTGDKQPFSSGDADLITGLIAAINAYIALRLNLPEEKNLTIAADRPWWRRLGSRMAVGFLQFGRWLGIGDANRFYDVAGDGLILIWVVIGALSVYVWKVQDAEIEVVKNAALFFIGAVISIVGTKLTGK